jgi:hypothetical protein
MARYRVLQSSFRKGLEETAAAARRARLFLPVRPLVSSQLIRTNPFGLRKLVDLPYASGNLDLNAANTLPMPMDAGFTMIRELRHFGDT